MLKQNILIVQSITYIFFCIIVSRNINYDVSLLSGTDYINVTWNKVNNQNKIACYIVFLQVTYGYFIF